MRIALATAITALRQIGGAVVSSFTIDRTTTRIDSTAFRIDKTVL